MLSGFFGGLALLLAALGLYGVTSYAATRRRIDVGIRMALGARPGAVIAHVLSRMSMLVGAGIVAGAVSSLWVSRLVVSLLYGVEPHDSVTLARHSRSPLSTPLPGGCRPGVRRASIQRKCFGKADASMRHRDELDKELRFTSTNASPTSAAAAVLPIGVALVAAYVPARRASEIDPARVLRES